MSRIRYTTIAGIISLFGLACMAVNFSQLLPVNTPTKEPIIVSFSTHVQDPTLTSPTAEEVSVPAWVRDFADPILTTLHGRPPDFQDDFAGYNLGWFYVIPGSPDGPYYAMIQDDALILKTIDGTEPGNSMAYNPRLIRSNFVLSLDIRFGKAEPDNLLRLQFDQTADRSVELDLSRNEDWTIDWNLHNDLQSAAGTYYHFPPEIIEIAIIMQDTRCAVYLNHDPLAYLSDCRSGPLVQSSPMAVSFHLLASRGDNVDVTIDNVKMWDLDITPGLP